MASRSVLTDSPTLAMNQLCIQLEREGRKVYKLGFGQSPFPVPQSVVSKLQEFAAVKDYLPSTGLPELKRTLAHHYQTTEEEVE